MSYHEIEPEDKEFLEECPICGEGYMVPTIGDWYQCSECGVEAKMDDYGSLLFEDEDYEDDDEDEDDDERISVYDAAVIWASHGKDEDYTFGYSEDELEDAL